MSTLPPLFHRLATDINESRLEAAKLVGADVVINGLKENLKSRGEFGLVLLLSKMSAKCSLLHYNK